jgi:hypothetical protein
MAPEACEEQFCILPFQFTQSLLHRKPYPWKPVMTAFVTYDGSPVDSKLKGGTFAASTPGHSVTGGYAGQRSSAQAGEKVLP